MDYVLYSFISIPVQTHLYIFPSHNVILKVFHSKTAYLLQEFNQKYTSIVNLDLKQK